MWHIQKPVLSLVLICFYIPVTLYLCSDSRCSQIARCMNACGSWNGSSVNFWPNICLAMPSPRSLCQMLVIAVLTVHDFVVLAEIDPLLAQADGFEDCFDDDWQGWVPSIKLVAYDAQKESCNRLIVLASVTARYLNFGCLNHTLISNMVSLYYTDKKEHSSLRIFSSRKHISVMLNQYVQCIYIFFFFFKKVICIQSHFVCLVQTVHVLWHATITFNIHIWWSWHSYQMWHLHLATWPCLLSYQDCQLLLYTAVLSMWNLVEQIMCHTKASQPAKLLNMLELCWCLQGEIRCLDSIEEQNVQVEIDLYAHFTVV